jgi:hypothetical protein
MRDNLTPLFHPAVKFASYAECGQMEDFLQPLKRTKNTTAEMKENPVRLAFFTIEVKKIKCSVTAAGLKIPQ